jgi:hypothetical protein
MVFIKKQKKLKYWQIQNVLDELRLSYIEKSRGSSTTYQIIIPVFGIKLRIGDLEFGGEDHSWDVLYLKERKFKALPNYFLEDLMWLLIPKGYFAYIRELGRTDSKRFFRNVLVKLDWGAKIINKRIELCGDDPRYTFMKTRMEGLKDVSTLKIIDTYPCFFDYLL